MAFLNSKFPTLKLKHGVTKEIVDPVSVTGNGAREVRRKQNRWERFVWTIPARNLPNADKDAIYKFLRSTDMGLKSFLYQDPTFPEFNATPLPFRSSGTAYLNLPLDATTAGTHPVFNPVMGELVFRKNGNVVTATYNGVDSNGYPYVTITGGLLVTDVLTVTGPIYMTVRFNSTLRYSISAMSPSPLGGTCNVVPSVVELSDFQLIEVFER
jgi:hypothetical protein